MSRIILVTGGSRSGKSDHARVTAEALPGPRVFVATCPVVDEETAERIRRHQRERAARHWDTIEEPLKLAETIRRSQEYGVILVDCLTLWINNILYEADGRGQTVREHDMEAKSAELVDACSVFQGTVVLVTNEVGWGIVPENALARRYRDLVGRCNRIIARAADEVVLVACGIPMWLRKGNSEAGA